MGTHLFTLVSFASFLTMFSNLTLKKMYICINTEIGTMAGGETSHNTVVETEKKMLREY